MLFRVDIVSVDACVGWLYVVFVCGGEGDDGYLCVVLGWVGAWRCSTWSKHAGPAAPLFGGGSGAAPFSPVPCCFAEELGDG